MFYKYFNFNFSSLLDFNKTAINKEHDTITLYVLLFASILPLLLPVVWPSLLLIYFYFYVVYKVNNIKIFLSACALATIVIIFERDPSFTFFLVLASAWLTILFYKGFNDFSLKNKNIYLLTKFSVIVVIMSISSSDLLKFSLLITFGLYLLENYKLTLKKVEPKYKIDIYFKMFFSCLFIIIAFIPLYYVPFNIAWAALLFIARYFNNIPDITFYFLLYAIIFTSLLFAVYWWLKIYFFVGGALNNSFLNVFSGLISRQDSSKPSFFHATVVEALQLLAFLVIIVFIGGFILGLSIFSHISYFATDFLENKNILVNISFLLIAIVLVQLKDIFLAKNEQAWFTKIIVHLETISLLNIFKTLVIWYIISIIAVCVCFLLGDIVNLQLITISTDFLPSSLDINIFKNNVNTYYFYELIYRKLWF